MVVWKLTIVKCRSWVQVLDSASTHESVMADSGDTANRIEAALEANEARKKALLKHIQDLEAQLATVDNLIVRHSPVREKTR